jgi:hypothetical protein
VVQRWPSGGTYWRGSSQIGQHSGGCAEGWNWVPQATQMKHPAAALGSGGSPGRGIGHAVAVASVPCPGSAGVGGGSGSRTSAAPIPSSAQVTGSSRKSAYSRV